MQPQKSSDVDDAMLAKLRGSVSQINSSGRSRATSIPLDDKDDVVMGGTVMPSAQMGEVQRKRRPRNKPESIVALPNIGSDEESEALAVAEAVQPKADPAVEKLQAEVKAMKAEKETLEADKKKLAASLAMMTEDLDESQENVNTYEEMITAFTKQPEADLQEFVDLVYSWKGKAKDFDALEKSLADTKKQLADAKAEVEVQKKAVASTQANLKAAKASGPTPTPALATPAAASTDSTWKPKYEQAIKDLDAAKKKAEGLEKDVKAKEAEIADLKGRLQVALAAGAAAGPVDAGDEESDPLIAMVNKLMKDMEEMAKENEEYLAKLEQDIEQEAKPIAAVEPPAAMPKIRVTQEAVKAPELPKPALSAQPSGSGQKAKQK